MITLDEIKNLAAQVQLATAVVEKDYALGWLLWGIHQHPATREDWVFKGGTCLKKCYFETYRFSEDLDFSFGGSSPPNTSDLSQIFSEIADRTYQESGLEFPKTSIQFESFRNPRGSISIQGGIKYRSILRPAGGLHHMQRIKIDLTLDEPVILPPVIKHVDHPYSDKPNSDIPILAYGYEEIFAEKVRALGQRLRPRDLYDVIHLYRRKDLKPDRKTVYDTLKRKCQLRGIDIPTIEIIQSHENRAFLESEWENQLRHQIQILPDFDSFLKELSVVLDWIKGRAVEELGPIAVSAIGEQEYGIRTETIRSLVTLGIASSYLDRIRFAAANRFIVSLGYDGGLRDIEPYSLAKSSEGNLLLNAIRFDSRKNRTYRWDRIQSVEITERTFIPTYQVEITSSGSLPIHQLHKKTGRKKSFSLSSARSQGLTHIYKCPSCGRSFPRKTRRAQLKPHKDKNGYRCSGRRGFYERTDY